MNVMSVVSVRSIIATQVHVLASQKDLQAK